MAPAPSVAVVRPSVAVEPTETHGKGHANESEVIESVEKEAVPKRKATKSTEAIAEEEVVVEPIDGETPASERRASEASRSWDEHAAAREHAPTEPTIKSPTVKATKSPTVEATKSPTVEATKSPTVEATKSPTVEATATEAAAECHGWRCNNYSRPEHGRRKATEEFAFHDSDPPLKEFIPTSAG